MGKNELVLEKGKILDVAKQYKQQRQMKNYLEYINELLDFQDELKEYKESVVYVEKEVENIIKKINNMTIGKDEAESNFVKFIKGYSVKDWKKVLTK